MNFSELMKQSGNLAKFSPDGMLMANISAQYRLVVREVRTLTIRHMFTCIDCVQHIEWAPDSSFVLCGMFKRGCVQVWSIDYPDWTCKIDEGSAGLVGVQWSPDSRHVLTTADFQLRITVWSLMTKSVSYIKYPKKANPGLDFTKDGKYLALAERRDCKDYVSIFTVSTWQLVKHFETSTRDLAGIKWSPDSRVLCIWDSILDYSIQIYSMDGKCLSSYSAYDNALGIKSVAWSPSCQFLGIGSFDQKARLLNHVTWKVICEQSHPSNIESTKGVIYQEVDKKPDIANRENEFMANGSDASIPKFTTQSRYDVLECPVNISTIRPDPEKANPKIGIGEIRFSSDNKYMMTVNDNMPSSVWIWDMKRLILSALLLQKEPVKCVEWDPVRPRLALCCGSNKLYLWSPAGCVSVEVPTEVTLQVSALKWHPQGTGILLIAKDHLCMCFLNTQ